MALSVAETPDFPYAADEVQCSSDAHWLSVAKQIALSLRETAVARERQGEPPLAEIKLLRESGLLALLNPQAAGGAGASFTDSFRVVRILARADTNVAQLLSYHYLLSHVAYGRALPEQRAELHRRSVAERWFWGGASNPRDAFPVLTREGDGFRLNGRRNFASNAAVADRITVRVLFENEVLLLAVPNPREGVVHGHDWDAFGQKLTESGSIEFRNVRIERDHILGDFPPVPGTAVPPAATLGPPLHQLYFVNFYLGTAEGALSEAKEYVLTSAKPWQTSGVSAASADPYTLEHYGTLDADLRASLALADVAAAEIETAIARGPALTQAERDAAAATVYAAKVHSTRTALDITSRIFDLMGARATAGRYGFDRFWRNIRTHTLHDPLAYKAREVGNFALNGRITPDPLYS
jgi:alkylation response protein AidB-like acyl-CoA dehydrogenase